MASVKTIIPPACNSMGQVKSTTHKSSCSCASCSAFSRALSSACSLTANATTTLPTPPVSQNQANKTLDNDTDEGSDDPNREDYNPDLAGAGQPNLPAVNVSDIKGSNIIKNTEGKLRQVSPKMAAALDGKANYVFSPQAYEPSPDSETGKKALELCPDLMEKINKYQGHLIFDPELGSIYLIKVISDKRPNAKTRPLPWEAFVDNVNSGQGDEYEEVRGRIVGVEAHERLHQLTAEQAPDVKTESLMQMFELDFGVEENGGIHFSGWTSSGKTDFNVDKLVEAHVNVVHQAEQAKQIYNKGKTNNFTNWTKQTFTNLMEALKSILQKLLYIGKEDDIMVLCGEAPVALTSLNKDFDNTMSKEDTDLSTYFSRLQKHALSFAKQIKNILADLMNEFKTRFGD
jgi:hypothetical protein